MVVKKKVVRKKVTKQKAQKGHWKTPAGVKSKSRFTPQENFIIKKYRAKGIHSLTPNQKTILMRASFK
jgi:hypothetical protein